MESTGGRNVALWYKYGKSADFFFFFFVYNDWVRPGICKITIISNLNLSKWVADNVLDYDRLGYLV